MSTAPDEGSHLVATAWGFLQYAWGPTGMRPGRNVLALRPCLSPHRPARMDAEPGAPRI